MIATQFRTRPLCALLDLQRVCWRSWRARIGVLFVIRLWLCFLRDWFLALRVPTILATALGVMILRGIVPIRVSVLFLVEVPYMIRLLHHGNLIVSRPFRTGRGGVKNTLQPNGRKEIALVTRGDFTLYQSLAPLGGCRLAIPALLGPDLHRILTGLAGHVRYGAQR